MVTKEKLEDIANEETGIVCGVVIGVGKGLGEGLFLPTYVRQRLDPESIPLGQPLPNILDFERYINRDNSRFYKAASMGFAVSNNLARLAPSVAMVIDLSDGSPDNVGYAAIPFILSGLYEVGRVIYKKCTQKSEAPTKTFG